MSKLYIEIITKIASICYDESIESFANIEKYELMNVRVSEKIYENEIHHASNEKYEDMI